MQENAAKKDHCIAKPPAANTHFLQTWLQPLTIALARIWLRQFSSLQSARKRLQTRFLCKVGFQANGIAPVCTDTPLVLSSDTRFAMPILIMVCKL